MHLYTSVENLHCSGVRASLARGKGWRGAKAGEFPSGWVERVYIHVHMLCMCTHI